MKLSQWIDNVQKILDTHHGVLGAARPQSWDWPATLDTTPTSSCTAILHENLATALRAQVKEPNVEALLQDGIDGPNTRVNTHPNTTSTTNETKSLRKVLTCFASSDDPLRNAYANDLIRSFDALEQHSKTSQNDTYHPPNLVIISRKIHSLKQIIADHFSTARDALSMNDARSRWLRLADLWPLETSVDILETLRSTSSFSFGAGVKEMIVTHGVLITKLQRLARIRYNLNHNKPVKWQEELANPGYENWDPLKNTDWMLLQADSNMMIRKEQVDVARAIIDPSSKANSLVQLNMGKGELKKNICMLYMITDT